MALNLSKQQAVLNLEKRQNDIKAICLEKEPLQNITARVAVAVDISGSMHHMIEDGNVQTVIERLLPIAMQFDDNGEMEIWTFNTSIRRRPAISLDNFYGYISEHQIKANGGTNYAPVLMDICNYFIMEQPADLPNYIIFITDGDNFDKKETDEIIKFISEYPIFIQFIGIGNSHSFHYLEDIDNMKGRYVDNANFFAIDNIHDEKTLPDNILYGKLLNEYPKWLELPEVKQMISNAASYCNDKKLKKSFKKQMKKHVLSKKKYTDSNLPDVIETICDIIELISDIID